MPASYRPATPADKPEVLAISAHFPNDWLAWGYDAMTEAGRFFVAEADEEDGPVIAGCGYEALGETAWLQAMRVHPDYHNRGVATSFTLYLMEHCRRAGFRRVRLDTALDNHPVHDMMAKLGFRDRGNFHLCWQPYSGQPLAVPADTSAVRAGTPSDAEAIWAFLRLRAAAGRLDPVGLADRLGQIYQAADLDPDRLASSLAAGNVMVAQAAGSSGDLICGVALWCRMVEEVAAGSVHKTFDHTDIAYLEGEPAVQAALLAAIFEAARRAGPVKLVQMGLLECQWRTVVSLLHPDWIPKPEDTFEATIYEKEL